ncbi:DUF1700 domain-containing protein [Lentilactobacillus parafarraginis]|uniref:Integral membrane protein n=2 Tax=Lentilactobacillus parafarraginis TaxID=390842 RepID=A0A0R1YUA4_9LACO|nr:DUF1700 domain-containing protein [Lentilactobacillus parafarraginis]KRM45933.1 hypothetical protein FD47_GL000117 [Lentilactobacillus parafarraginis DSM 18390 = JCM 14109]TLQ19300.1 DUF1700 domain-containing protein [Lentilactobacillus parafarraginis]
MNDYIAEFTGLLSQLDAEERSEVVDFYTEYLQDGNFTAYNDCVRELGTPRQLARKVLADYSIKNLQADQSSDKQSRAAKPKDNVKTVWLIILAVLSTPVTIPLALGLAGLSVAIFATAFSILVGLIALAVGIIFGGLGSLVVGIGILPSDAWLSMLYIGVGMTVVGILVLMSPVFSAAFNGIIRGVTNFSQWAYHKVVPQNRAEKHGKGRQK